MTPSVDSTVKHWVAYLAQSMARGLAGTKDSKMVEKLGDYTDDEMAVLSVELKEYWRAAVSGTQSVALTVHKMVKLKAGC